MRKSLIAVVVAASLSAVTPTSAQTLIQHFSKATIAKVGARFSAALRNGGMTGVVADIKSCYAATTFKQTKANGEAIAFCMLYDYSAWDLDKGMRTAFVASGTNDPGNVSSYLTEQALDARFDIYASIPFGRDPAAVGAYFADAPNRVLDVVEAAHPFR